MPENKKLNEDELEKVNGGFAGPNAHEKEAYHAAGFLTDWGFTHYDVCAFHAGNGAIYGGWERVYLIDKYVEYYQSHTLEEYVNYVRTNSDHKDYNYNQGYDMS